MTHDEATAKATLILSELQLEYPRSTQGRDSQSHKICVRGAGPAAKRLFRQVARDVAGVNIDVMPVKAYFVLTVMGVAGSNDTPTENDDDEEDER